MARKKVCMFDKLFVDGTECPLCKGQKFSLNWQGRLFIADAEKSDIAEKIGIKVKGEYAIKCR